MAHRPRGLADRHSGIITLTPGARENLPFTIKSGLLQVRFVVGLYILAYCTLTMCPFETAVIIDKPWLLLILSNNKIFLSFYGKHRCHIISWCMKVHITLCFYAYIYYSEHETVLSRKQQCLLFAQKPDGAFVYLIMTSRSQLNCDCGLSETKLEAAWCCYRTTKPHWRGQGALTSSTSQRRMYCGFRRGGLLQYVLPVYHQQWAVFSSNPDLSSFLARLEFLSLACHAIWNTYTVIKSAILTPLILYSIFQLKI